MSWSRFITVENLCIAAEVTAALLLLAFAFPEKRTPSKGSEGGDSRDSMEDLKKLFMAWKLNQGLAVLAAHRALQPIPPELEFPEDDLSSVDRLNWLDRLSGTYNRSFFDLFLTRWLSLPSELRAGSFLSMISIEDYSERVRESGAMNVELTLREIGKKLNDEYAHRAIIARLPPDRFVLVNFDLDPSMSLEAMEVANAPADEDETTAASESNKVPFVASCVDLADEIGSPDDALGSLEEGAALASQSSQKCVLKRGADWSEEIPRSNRSQPRSNKNGNRGNRARGASGNTETNAESPAELAKESANLTAGELENAVAREANSETNTSQDDGPLVSKQVESEPSKAADVSAVASNEEIAALFAQIKKNGKNAASGDSVPESPQVQQATSKDSGASPAQVGGKSESDLVSADDISALFAATKKPATPSAAPAATPVPAKKPSASVSELDDMSETVSSDDISELFKAVQSEQAKPSSPTSANPKPKATKKEFVAEVEDLSETTTTDDIAELFKAVQSGMARGGSASSQTPPPAPQSSPVVDDPSETATADDIASLFATVKAASSPATSATASKTETQSKPATPALPAEDLSEKASSDDIAALFAQVKSGNS
ncbi:diguanylate cyclase domain-containing protein [Pirellulaceae bacterium SH449]